MATTGTPRRPASPAPPTNGRGAPTAPPKPPTRGGNGRGGNGRRRPVRKRRHPVLQAFIVGFQALSILILVALIVAMILIGSLLRSAPTSIDLTFDPPGRTMIYSSDGTLLAKLFVENRQVVTIDQIPKDLQDATIAFEDKRFYLHSGVDLQGILRALGRNIKSGDLKGQGGSTITQQLARNMGVEGLTREKSVQRKIHEWVVANQIEKSYTKQRILEMYLNQVNYGQGAYGVEAAAQTYFGKDVSKLDLAQCALLAGLPNRPAYFNPYKDKDAAKAQRDIVLGNMLAQHYVTPDQYQKALAEPIKLAAPKPPKQGSQIYHAAYFVDYVIQQLQSRYGKDYLTRGNLEVETSLNWPMQQAAEAAVQNHINAGSSYGPNQAALVALDPKTGEIKAMVGGVSYAKNQFNIAAYGRRQPGSSFKAVVYSAAIDSGVVTENTTVYDAPVSFSLGGKLWTPKDDNGYSYRRVGLREAMAQSINVPAVKVLKLLGPDTAVRYARVMGVESPLDPVLSLALGSSGVTPLEMADVYATIAAGGNHPVVTPFTRLADSDGKTIEDIPPAVETHVLKPSTVTQVDDMLRAVVTDGTGKPVGDVPDARGKTGTTQGHKDVWFVGYTPQLVCAVWAGHPLHNAKTGQDSYGMEMGGGAWGMTICAPIWRDFMLKGLPIYQAAMAKETARNKPAAKSPVPPPPPLPAATTDTTDNGYRHYRRHHRDDLTADGTDQTATTAPVTDSTQNADGTTTATVDDDTGLLAPPGSAHSHQETFSPGAAPAVMAPQYDSSGDGSAPPTTSTDSAPRRRRHQSQDNGDSAPATVPSDNGDSGNGDSAGSDSAPRRAAAPPKPKEPEYVTVRVNPDDGLLATQWTPQYVEKRYLKGHEPHRYSHMYQPPPGER